MGEKDSSKTRVQPFFKKIFDAKNADWIVSLLIAFDSGLARSMAENAGIPKFDTIDKYFERKLAPPERFLEWLIQNPSKLTWPEGTKYGVDTKKKREDLIKNDTAIQREALQNLKHYGAEQSYKKWWAFEGFTFVDCLIETDKIVFAVEGKRTETGPAKAVSWYSKRNQIVRNLEAVQQYADGRQYGVALIDESGTYQLSSLEIDESLPHLSQQERNELINHFLGSVTWKSVCSKTGIDYNSLPDTV